MKNDTAVLSSSELSLLLPPLKKGSPRFKEGFTKEKLRVEAMTHWDNVCDQLSRNHLDVCSYDYSYVQLLRIYSSALNCLEYSYVKKIIEKTSKHVNQKHARLVRECLLCDLAD